MLAELIFDAGRIIQKRNYSVPPTPTPAWLDMCLSHLETGFGNEIPVKYGIHVGLSAVYAHSRVAFLRAHFVV